MSTEPDRAMATWINPGRGFRRHRRGRRTPTRSILSQKKRSIQHPWRSRARRRRGRRRRALDLQRHPDGGFYLETFRDPSISLPTAALPPRYKVDRAVSSAIYFLLPAGEIARLHRIPCAETWHYYLGEPLTVFEVHDDGQIKMTVVGPDLPRGQRPQYTVPPNVWFGAFLTCDIESFTEDGSVFVKTPGRDPAVHYSFVGVTCAPAFQFEDDELATREEMKALAPKAEAFINYLVPS